MAPDATGPPIPRAAAPSLDALGLTEGRSSVNTCSLAARAFADVDTILADVRGLFKMGSQDAYVGQNMQAHLN